jgi:hypothetical protein
LLDCVALRDGLQITRPDRFGPLERHGQPSGAARAIFAGRRSGKAVHPAPLATLVRRTQASPRFNTLMSHKRWTILSARRHRGTYGGFFNF